MTRITDGIEALELQAHKKKERIGKLEAFEGGKRMGRPFVEDETPRSAIIHSKVTEQDKLDLVALAQSREKSMSEMLSILIRVACGRYK